MRTENYSESKIHLIIRDLNSPGLFHLLMDSVPPAARLPAGEPPEEYPARWNPRHRREEHYREMTRSKPYLKEPEHPRSGIPPESFQAFPE